jgi:hypothetical protein
MIPKKEHSASLAYDYSHWARFGIVGEIRHWRNADVQHDIDLVRKILIELRNKQDLKPAPVIIKGYDPVLVSRHVERLCDAGLIEGRALQSLGMEAPMILATDLSLDGHAFLGSLETKEVWNRLKHERWSYYFDQFAA